MSDDKIIRLGDKAKHHKVKAQEIKEESEITVAPIEYCSFCHRPNTQVVKMVKGPNVNICSECTMIAVQYLILEDKMPSGEAQRILDMFWNKLS